MYIDGMLLQTIHGNTTEQRERETDSNLQANTPL